MTYTARVHVPEIQLVEFAMANRSFGVLRFRAKSPSALFEVSPGINELECSIPREPSNGEVFRVVDIIGRVAVFETPSNIRRELARVTNVTDLRCFERSQ